MAARMFYLTKKKFAHTAMPRCIAEKTTVSKKTLALLLTGILLYIPANTLPMLSTRLLGNDSKSTIIGGVIELWAHGSYPIAAVIFIASVLVPLAKFCSMLWLRFSIKKISRL
jgi:uncharacterized paraquat-inducible protein A